MYQQIEETTVPTPEELATLFRESGMPEDDVLDLLRKAGELYGWNDRLNKVGLLYLKPDVPEGRDARHE